MGEVWVSQVQEKYKNINIGMHLVSLRNNEDT